MRSAVYPAPGRQKGVLAERDSCLRRIEESAVITSDILVRIVCDGVGLCIPTDDLH